MTHRKQSTPFLTQTEAIDDGAGLSREEIDAQILSVHGPKRSDEKTAEEYAMLTGMSERTASDILLNASRRQTLVDGFKITRRSIGRCYLYKFTRPS